MTEGSLSLELGWGRSNEGDRERGKCKCYWFWGLEGWRSRGRRERNYVAERHVYRWLGREGIFKATL